MRLDLGSNDLETLLRVVPTQRFTEPQREWGDLAVILVKHFVANSSTGVLFFSR